MFKLLMSQEQAELMDARASCNKEKERRILKSMNDSKNKRTQQDYDALKNVVGNNVFQVFYDIDITYQRHNGFTRDILFTGSTYEYHWEIDNHFKYNGKQGRLMLEFSDMRWGLSVWIDDENYYNDAPIYLHSNIDSYDIQSVLQNITS